MNSRKGRGRGSREVEDKYGNSKASEGVIVGGGERGCRRIRRCIGEYGEGE